MKNKFLSNINKLYAYWFFHSLILAYVIERLFWEARGMTVQQVVYTEMVYAFVVIILEVPTGALADYWSRKSMMVLYAVLSFMEFFILIFAHTFWHFALAVSVAAVGKALSSGAGNALLYDSLKMAGEEQDFEKVLGRVSLFDRTGCILAALFGGIVAWKLPYEINYWLSLISVAVSFFIALTLMEPTIRTDNERTSYREYIKDAYNFLKGSPSLKFVIFYGVVIASCLTYVDEFWQIYLKEIRIPVLFFGAVSAGNSFIFSIISAHAHRLKERFSYKVIFTALLSVFTVALILSSFMHSAAGLIILVLVFAAGGAAEPLVFGYLHHRTESEVRATVESMQSLVMRSVIIAVGLFFGWFSTRYNIFSGFRFLGLLTMSYMVYFLILQFRFLEK